MAWVGGMSTRMAFELSATAAPQQGTSTYFIISPEHRAGVVVLTNMEDINPCSLAFEILKVLRGTAGSVPKN